MNSGFNSSIHGISYEKTEVKRGFVIWFRGTGLTFRLCQVTVAQILENRAQVVFTEVLWY